ncbi:hypothetical protein GJAV_G00090710 [Gymnothorax javanicus]|nr:hypothetical protein GJAV_G00090710 [Gymnothorax javanicus]
MTTPKPPMTTPKPPMTAPKPPMTTLKPTSEVNGNLIRKEMDGTAEILTPQHETKHENLREKNNELQELNMNLQENNNTRKEVQSQNEAKGVFAGMFRNAPNDRTPTFTSYVTDIPSEEEESRLGKQEKGGMFSGMFKKSPKPVKRTVPAQEDESTQSDLPASNNSIPDVSTKEKGGMFSGMFKKPQKPPGGAAPGQADLRTQSERSDNTEDNLTTNTQQTASDDSLSGTNMKEKGGMFSRMFKKVVKPAEHTAPAQETGSVHSELSASDGSLSDGSTKDNLSTDNKLSASNESLSDITTKEKGGKFTRMLKKASKHAEHAVHPKESESDSDDSLSDNDTKEKGGMFSGMFKSKAPKHSKDVTSAQDNLSTHSELSGSNEALSDNQTSKDKKAGFSGMFKKAFKPVETTAPAQEDESTQRELSASNDNLTDANVKERGGVFGGMFKKHPKTSEGPTQASQSQDELSASSENLSEINTKEKAGMFSGMFRSKSDKNFEHYSHEEDNLSAHRELSASSDHLSDNTKEKGGMLTGMFRWAAKPEEHKGSAQKNESAMNRELSSSNENLLDAPSKEKGGMFSGMFRSKHPKPSQDPASDQEAGLTRGELSASDDRLSENSTKEKGGKFAGMFRRGPRPAESSTAAQVSVDSGADKGGGLLRKRKTSFRVRKTLPRTPKIRSPMKDIEEEDLLAEPVEMEESGPVQGSSVEIEMVEMAPLPKDGNPLEEDDDGLLDWWRTVEGWDEWNESSNFKEDEQELAVEQAADRVYLAAQLFVRLFNQRGASLQQRILELLSLADAADNFHKRTVAASMGGGVASVVGSVTTITGLILAPFTFGTSIIVTAVGIGVATAGGIASASANITDTVHSNMDRKKVEKMIQGYQDEIKDIRECMEFVQAGMDALQEWDFEKYTESVASRALNQNVKHVVKEGARAGKALMINTDQLISTVQVLSVAGGAAKAAQAISVTTGVMSALFLALDIFFLAKDSHELRKGAKTQFATKLREVCKELQDGLLDLNRVKTELQKTMDGVEVEEFEEEEEEDDEDLDLESDPASIQGHIARGGGDEEGEASRGPKRLALRPAQEALFPQRTSLNMTPITEEEFRSASFTSVPFTVFMEYEASFADFD